MSLGYMFSFSPARGLTNDLYQLLFTINRQNAPTLSTNNYGIKFAYDLIRTPLCKTLHPTVPQYRPP